MASPAPALLALLGQINARWPNRSRRSDGIMGDAAHRARRSAHNVGDALDVTADPVHGPDLELMVADLCRQMRANPNGRINLMIYRRRIYSSRDLFRGRAYTGVNPHLTHAHIEVRHELRAVTRPWSLVG